VHTWREDLPVMNFFEPRQQRAYVLLFVADCSDV